MVGATNYHESSSLLSEILFIYLDCFGTANGEISCSDVCPLWNTIQLHGTRLVVLKASQGASQFNWTTDFKGHNLIFFLGTEIVTPLATSTKKRLNIKTQQKRLFLEILTRLLQDNLQTSSWAEQEGIIFIHFCWVLLMYYWVPWIWEKADISTDDESITWQPAPELYRGINSSSSKRKNMYSGWTLPLMVLMAASSQNRKLRQKEKSSPPEMDV